MSNEIEELRKRLQAVENDVAELRAGSLFVAQIVGKQLCESSYKGLLRYHKGEERRAYEEFWKPRRDAVYMGIDDAPTIKKAMQLAVDFLVELADYVAATKIDTADKAMEIAHSFIKKYSPVALPMKAEREGDVWLVDVDVGALAVKIAKVKVDARTGDILSYEIPTK